MDEGRRPEPTSASGSGPACVRWHRWTGPTLGFERIVKTREVVSLYIFKHLRLLKSSADPAESHCCSFLRLLECRRTFTPFENDFSDNVRSLGFPDVP